jgi:uncharacterized protein
MMRAFAALLLAVCACSDSSDYEKGMAAYHREDYKSAFRHMQKGASLGDPDAAYELGHLYSHGHGTQEDQIAAQQWYKKAADSYLISATAGNARSQTRLCFMFASGSGVAEDYAEAFRWCEKAAQQGNSTAQRNLSSFYEHGLGVKKDLEKAKYWKAKFLETEKEH